MRKLLQLSLLIMLVALVAACGGSPTPAIPTSDPNAGTPEASITPNPELAEESTAEATADSTSESTAEATADSTMEATAEVSAEGTAEVLNTAFNIQVAGDTELEFVSDDGASVEETFSDAGVGGQSTLNTPGQTLQIFQFTSTDQSTFFELTVSTTVVEGTYEIGVDNVGSTIGNNINEDAAGSTSTTGAESTAEATSDAEMTAEAESTAEATQDSAAPTTAPNDALNSSGAPSTGPSEGVVERDETLPPTIAARLESVDGDGMSYNLLTGGTLTIDERTENSISGSFEFTLSPADDESTTVTVTGTFTDLSLIPEDAFMTPAP